MTSGIKIHWKFGRSLFDHNTTYTNRTIVDSTECTDKKKTWELSRDRFVLYSALLEFFFSLIFKFNSFLSTCWWYHELVRLNCSYFLVFRFRWHPGMMYHTFESQTYRNGQFDFIIDTRDLRKFLLFWIIKTFDRRKNRMLWLKNTMTFCTCPIKLRM